MRKQRRSQRHFPSISIERSAVKLDEIEDDAWERDNGHLQFHVPRRELVRIMKRVEELETEIAKAGGDWSKVIPGGNPFGNWTITKLLYALGGPLSPGCGKIMLHVMNKNPIIFYDSMIQFSHIFSIYYTLLGILALEQALMNPGVSSVREALRFLWMLQGCWCLTGLVMCLHVMIVMQRMTPWELQATLYQKPVAMSVAYSLGPVGFFFLLLCLVTDTVAHFIEVSNEYGRSTEDWVWLFVVLGIGIGIPLAYAFLHVVWFLSDAARPFEQAYREYLEDMGDKTKRNQRLPEDNTSLESLITDALNEVHGQSKSKASNIDISGLANSLENQGITAKAILAAAETGQSQLLNDLLKGPEAGLNHAQAFQVTAALIKYGSKNAQNRTSVLPSSSFW